MTDIRFYHLQRQSLDQVLPLILFKALEKGHRAVVRLPDEKEVERINQLLWTWNPDSFLPHGSKKDGFAEDQPVWLTDKEENPNNADVLILTSGVRSDAVGEYALCCEMLNGHNDAQVSEARQRWKAYKEAGHTITYWQQNDRGGWDKKS